MLTNFNRFFKFTANGCLTLLRFVLCLCSVLPLCAQTNEEVFREYQFNFNLPGARANGMGGAFIGLADDATSSFTNPAGLAFLAETAVTLDWRNQHLKGQTGTIEGFFNTRFDVEPRDLNLAAFFSLNFNYRGWYFGLFQHNYVNEQQKRSFQSRSLSTGVETLEVRDIDLDLSGTALGLGIARRLGAFKLGLAVNYLTFDANTSYQRSAFTFRIPRETVAYTSKIGNSDRDWGYTVGLLHETGSAFSWGAVLRTHPTFSLKEDILEEVDGQPVLVGEDVPVPFVVPDVFGMGIRYKVQPVISLLLDWQRIFYSQLIEDGFVIVEDITDDSKANYAVKDTNELHVGMEWLFPTARSVWVARAGYYHNPVHAVTYRGDNVATIDRFAQIGLVNQNHYTLGAGWVFQNAFELDFSANFWEEGREVTASIIWRKK